MLRIAVCDNEVFFLKSIESLIEKYATQTNTNIKVYKYTSAFKLLDSLENEYDAFFLDANMPVIDGMQIAEIIRKVDRKAYICFITSTTKYLYEGYSMGINGYIKKPVVYDIIKMELNRIVKEIDLSGKKNTIIKNGELIIKLYLTDIVFVETANRKILIHTYEDDYYDNRKIGNFEQEFGSYHFFRCHNSYIVNLDYIEQIKNKELILTSGVEIPLSKYKRNELIDNYTRYLKKD